MKNFKDQFGKVPLSKVSIVAIAIVFTLGTVTFASFSGVSKFGMASVLHSEEESDITPIEEDDIEDTDSEAELEVEQDELDSEDSSKSSEDSDQNPTELIDNEVIDDQSSSGSYNDSGEPMRELSQEAIEIYDCNDLQSINLNLSGSYEIMDSFSCDSNNIVPIGTAENPFRGTLNGQFNTIFNLNIDSDNTPNVGLFGAIDEGAGIYNLFISNAYVNNYYEGPEETSTGILVGRVLENASISINNLGIATGYINSISSNIGGLVGYIEDSFGQSVISWPNISDLHIYIETDSGTYSNFGGIVGYGEVVEINNANVTGVSLTIYDIDFGTPTIENIGGFIGFSGRESLITNSRFIPNNNQLSMGSGMSHNVGGLVGYNMGQITRSVVKPSQFQSFTLSGDQNIGGIAGINTGQISQSYTSQLSIYGNHNAGGIAGSFGVDPLAMEDPRIVASYAASQLISSFNSAGGLVGLIPAQGGEIFHSFSASNVDQMFGSPLGAIVGSGSDFASNSNTYAYIPVGSSLSYYGDSFSDFSDFIYTSSFEFYSENNMPFLNAPQLWSSGAWCFTGTALPTLASETGGVCGPPPPDGPGEPELGDVELIPNFTSTQPTINIAGQSTFTNLLVGFFTTIKNMSEQDLRDSGRVEQADEVAAMTLEEFYEFFKDFEQNPFYGLVSELEYLGVDADLSLKVLESNVPVRLNVGGPTYLNIGKASPNKNLEFFATRVPADLVNIFKNFDLEALEAFDQMFEAPEQIFLFLAEEFKFLRALNLTQGTSGYNLVIPTLPGTDGYLLIATLDPSVTYNFLPNPEQLLMQLPAFNGRGGFGLLSSRNLLRNGFDSEPEFDINLTIQLHPIQNSTATRNQTVNLNNSIQGIQTPSNFEFSNYQGMNLNREHLKFIDYTDELIAEMFIAFLEIPEVLGALVGETILACIFIDNLDPEQAELFEVFCSQLGELIDIDQIIQDVIEQEELDDISDLGGLREAPDLIAQYASAYLNESNIDQLREIFFEFALIYFNLDELDFELPFSIYRESPGINLNTVVPGLNELKMSPSSEGNADNGYIALAYEGSRSQLVQDVLTFTTNSGINLLPFVPIRLEEPTEDPSQILTQFLSKFGLLGFTTYISLDTGEPGQSFNLDFGQIVFNGLAPKGYDGSLIDLLTFTKSNYSEMTVLVLEVENFLSGNFMGQYVGRGLDSIDIDEVVTLLSDPEFQLNLYTFPVSPLGSQPARRPISGSDPCKVNPSLPQCPEDAEGSQLRGAAGTLFNPQAGTSDEDAQTTSRLESTAVSSDSTATVARISQDGTVITENDFQKLIRQCGEQRLELLVLNNFESCNLELSEGIDRLLRINLVEETSYFQNSAIPISGTILVRNPEIAETVHILVKQDEEITHLASNKLSYLPSTFEGRRIANFSHFNDVDLPDGEYELIVMVKAIDGRNFGHSKTIVIGGLEDQQEFPNAPKLNSFGLQQASQVVPSTREGRLTVSDNTYIKPIADLDLEPGYIVNAIWNSKVLLSASVADLITGKANLSPPNDFELNQNYTHTLTLYAYNPEDPSIVGQAVVLEFPSGQHKPSKLPKAGGMLALLALLAAAGYYYYKNINHTKSKKKTAKKK